MRLLSPFSLANMISCFIHVPQILQHSGHPGNPTNRSEVSCLHVHCICYLTGADSYKRCFCNIKISFAVLVNYVHMHTVAMLTDSWVCICSTMNHNLQLTYMCHMQVTHMNTCIMDWFESIRCALFCCCEYSLENQMCINPQANRFQQLFICLNNVF